MSREYPKRLDDFSQDHTLLLRDGAGVSVRALLLLQAIVVVPAN